MALDGMLDGGGIMVDVLKHDAVNEVGPFFLHSLDRLVAMHCMILSTTIPSGSATGMHRTEFELLLPLAERVKKRKFVLLGNGSSVCLVGEDIIQNVVNEITIG